MKALPKVKKVIAHPEGCHGALDHRQRLITAKMEIVKKEARGGGRSMSSDWVDGWNDRRGTRYRSQNAMVLGGISSCFHLKPGRIIDNSNSKSRDRVITSLI